MRLGRDRGKQEGVVLTQTQKQTHLIRVLPQRPSAQYATAPASQTFLAMSTKKEGFEQTQSVRAMRREKVTVQPIDAVRSPRVVRQWPLSRNVLFLALEKVTQDTFCDCVNFILLFLLLSPFVFRDFTLLSFACWYPAWELRWRTNFGNPEQGHRQRKCFCRLRRTTCNRSAAVKFLSPMTIL